MIVDRPSVSLGLCFNLFHRSAFLWSTVVPAVIKRVVDDNTRHSDRLSAILTPEIFERLLKERKADSCEIFWLNWYEHETAGMVCGRGQDGLRRRAVNYYEILVLEVRAEESRERSGVGADRTAPRRLSEKSKRDGMSCSDFFWSCAIVSNKEFTGSGFDAVPLRFGGKYPLKTSTIEGRLSMRKLL